MATYKITDVLHSIQSMLNDGYEYINISESLPDEADDDEAGAALFIDAIEDALSSETDIIDSVTLPDNYCCQLQ